MNILNKFPTPQAGRTNRERAEIAPTVLEALPAFAQDIVVALKHGQLPAGVERQELNEAAKQEAGRGVFAASMLASMDEKAGQDQALGEPGKVIQKNMTEVFVSGGKNQIEAVLLAPSKDTGEPGVLYVYSGPEGIQSFGVVDHGDKVEVRGTVLTPTGPNEFGGFVISGQPQK